MAEDSPRNISTEDYENLKTKYEKLRQSHRVLREEHAKCTAYIQRAEKLYQAAKESARQWKSYLDRHGWVPSISTDISVPISGSRKKSPVKAGIKRITSSQTTEDEPNVGPSVDAVIAQDDDDDEPEIVSARPVKRRRKEAASAQPRIKIEPVSQMNPLVLPEASSPQHFQAPLPRKQISDLDAIVGQCQTPRKRKDAGAWSEGKAKPPVLPAGFSSLSKGDVSAPIGMAIEDSSIERRLVDDVQERPLQPLSVNVPSVPRTKSRRKEEPTDPHSSAYKHNMLSEDGDMETSQVATDSKKAPAKASFDHRLQDLLSEGPVERRPLGKRSSEPKLISRERTPPVPASNRRSLPKKPPRLSDPTFAASRLEPAPRAPDPSEEPLRLRPLPRLSLDDFKINPAYLGSNHAFADPIRGRDARRCLPGCTRPECCGEGFRKAVEVGGLPSKPDAEVLEEFFGSDYATIMAAYGPDERKKYLIQARAASLANQHGKHRRAFERRSTPPGFWRTDMPSTQEMEQDRAEAMRMEREKVEERWREAFKERGRWMFRDE